jgi:hypothetical protein
MQQQAGEYTPQHQLSQLGGISSPYNARPHQQNPMRQQAGEPTPQQQMQRMQQQNPMQQFMSRLRGMPLAPNSTPMGQEDPRMQAMRNLQRYRGGR